MCRTVPAFRPAVTQQNRSIFLSLSYGKISSFDPNSGNTGLDELRLSDFKLIELRMQPEPCFLKLGATLAELAVPRQGCDPFIAPGFRVKLRIGDQFIQGAKILLDPGEFVLDFVQARL